MITTMEEAIEMVQAKDTKERMAGVERLQQLLEHSTKSLSATEVSNLVDASMALLKDNNFRVSQGALQALAFAASLSGEHLKLHFNALLPAIVERLGDGKQPVRDAARRLLLALMEVFFLSFFFVAQYVLSCNFLGAMSRYRILLHILGYHSHAEMNLRNSRDAICYN
jgi:hypothetical protein